jgi:hypothetical protein
MATWRSGYAAVCKTVYPGSIPGVASRKIKHLTTAATDQKFTSAIRQRISGRKMMAEPETRFEELRFAKQPQWSVATATMTLLGSRRRLLTAIAAVPSLAVPAIAGEGNHDAQVAVEAFKYA